MACTPNKKFSVEGTMKLLTPNFVVAVAFRLSLSLFDVLLKELHSQNFEETEEVVDAAFHTLNLRGNTLAASKKNLFSTTNLLIKKEENM